MKKGNENKGTGKYSSTAKVAAIYTVITVAALLATANSVPCAVCAVALLYGVYAYCKRDKRTAKALYKSMLKIQYKVLGL